MGTLDAILQDCRELLKHPASYAALLALPLFGCGKSSEPASPSPQPGVTQQQPAPPQPSKTEPQTPQSKILGKWVADDGTTAEFYDKGAVEFTLWKNGKREVLPVRDYEWLNQTKIRVKNPAGDKIWVLAESLPERLKFVVDQNKLDFRRYQEGAPSLEVRARAGSAPAVLKNPEITFVFNEGYAHHLPNLSTPVLNLKNAGKGVTGWNIPFDREDIEFSGGQQRVIRLYDLVNRGGQKISVQLPMVRISANQPLFAGESTEVEFAIKTDPIPRMTDKKEETYSGNIDVLWEAQGGIKEQTVPLTIRILPQQPQPVEMRRSIEVAVQEGEFRRYAFAAKAENAYLVALEAKESGMIQKDDFEILKLFREDNTPLIEYKYRSGDGHQRHYAFFKDKMSMLFGHQPTGNLVLQLNAVRPVAGKLTVIEAKPVPFSKDGNFQYAAGTTNDLSRGGKYATNGTVIPFEAQEGTSYITRAHLRDEAGGKCLLSYVCSDNDLAKVMAAFEDKDKRFGELPYDRAASPQGDGAEDYKVWSCPKSGKYWIALIGGDYYDHGKAPTFRYWLHSFPKK